MADNLTPDQRSYCMSRVRTKDTDLEMKIRSGLYLLGLRFLKHAKDLPGRPDIVFPKAKLAVFIDGDFWHGFRFPLWEHNLSPFWQEKIKKNRQRDQRNFNKLRRAGWKVIRLWQHQIERDREKCLAKILAHLGRGRPSA
ncbi:MAG: very short patch repair endonuclease [Desulfarculus sp.]|nr:very short patch repair endonuclease [Desulfarculus sp.]